MKRKNPKDEYQKEFEREENPESVIRFIKRYRFALREPWVLSEIKKWHEEGKYELLRKAFLPMPGERAEKYRNALLGLMLCDKVDGLVKTEGVKLCEAFKRVGLPDGTVLSPESIKNRYYRAKRSTPDFHIKEDAENLILACGPTRVKLGETPLGYGDFEIRIPKK